jgi:hypothetical protein
MVVVVMMIMMMMVVVAVVVVVVLVAVVSAMAAVNWWLIVGSRFCKTGGQIRIHDSNACSIWASWKHGMQYVRTPVGTMASAATVATSGCTRFRWTAE